MTALRVRGVTKAFHSFRRTHPVLKGIDLEIARGEVVGLIGPNGAGKTTLMSCLLDFLEPDDGEITIDGLPNDDLGIRRRTGFVPERMNFDRHATGFAFLRYMALLTGLEPRKADEGVRYWMQRLGIADAAGKKLSQYSRGMLQRLGMCQALVHEPEFVFLDEPTSGLDPNGVMLMREVITEQKARGALVLLNSHQLAEVERLCDRVLFLTGGVIAREERLRHADHVVVAITMIPGTFDDAKVTELAGSAPKENTVVVSVEDDAGIARLVRELSAAGVGVIDVRRHKADLEGIFRGNG